MENVEFNEEQPGTVSRSQQIPAKHKKPSITEWVMRTTGIKNRRTAEIILIVVAVLSAGAAFVFATAEKPPPPFPYQSPYAPGASGVPTGL